MGPTTIFDTQNRCMIALCSSTQTSLPNLNPLAQTIPEIFNIDQSNMAAKLERSSKGQIG
jgi:hypothetical protein